MERKREESISRGAKELIGNAGWKEAWFILEEDVREELRR